MTVVQISRIQHRRGSSGELPTNLEEAELGVTTDTGEVFIGAPNLPAIQGRSTYPYKNLKILTELDIQRTITGDVYYHGPIVSSVAPPTGTDELMFGLFPDNSRDFCNYDLSLESQDGNSKLVAMITICVHPSTPNLSVVNIAPGSVCDIGWPGGSASYPTTASQHFRLTSLNGVTWLTFRNSFGIPMILSLSGREWSTPPAA